MKKRLRIGLVILSIVMVMYGAGGSITLENLALAQEFVCDPIPESTNCEHLRGDDLARLSPEVRDLKELIAQDPTVRMYFTQMIDQVPLYYDNPTLYPKPYRYLKNIDQMLCLINDALDKSPEYNDTALVGFPINGILNWTMGTPAGLAVFRNARVNAIFRRILDKYGTFLKTGASRYVLQKGCGSWRSKAAEAALKMYQFEHDPHDPYWGFSSWNDFFTRKIKPEMRPIDGQNNPKVIVSACDSEIFEIQTNVKRSNWFWVKSQPYSLVDLLGGDAYAEAFVGGDVYQAFLSATKYHRWNSPVDGKIVKAYVKAGTYYAATASEGMDPASPDLSQGYIAHVATRAIIFIKADDSTIGLVGVMPVGMAEVSSCKITVKEGQKVKKGDELGMFQYGGSTYCLIFRPGVLKMVNNIKFRNNKGEPLKKGDAVNMGQMIAIAN